MSAELNFDANKVKPSERPAPVPNDWYTAAIIASKVEPVKSGNGQALKLDFQILDGPYKGRKIWPSLNIQHTNAQTQAIAQAELSAICHATGVMQLNNSAQLHNIPMRIRTIIVEQKGYDPKNEIKEYKKLEGATSIVPAAAAATPAVAPTQAANVPAWAAKKSA